MPVKLFDDLVDLLYIHLGFKLEVLDNYTEAKGRHTTTIYLGANHVHTMKHIEGLNTWCYANRGFSVIVCVYIKDN